MKFKPLKFIKSRKAENEYRAVTPAAEYEIQFVPEKGVYHAFRYSSLDDRGGFLCAFYDMESALFALNDRNERDLKIFLSVLEKDELYVENREVYVIREGLLAEYWTNSSGHDYIVFGDSDFMTGDIQIDGVKSLVECEQVIKNHYNSIKQEILDDIKNLTEEEEDD